MDSAILNQFPEEIKSSLDVNKCTFVELNKHDAVSNALHRYIADHCTQSFRWMRRNIKTYKEHEDKSIPKASLTAGDGLHRVPFRDTDVYILHARYGDVVGCSCGPMVEKRIHVLVEGIGAKYKALLVDFLDEVLKTTVTKNPTQILVYTWDYKRMFWKSVTKPKRSLDTIFLPEGVKEMVVDDIADFLDAKPWFNKHCIPYKRNYMMYGPPGSGKSSFIQALAGHFNRNVCFLQPANMAMDDDMFKDALDKAPRNSMIVLEDIDSLFGKDRSKTNKTCPLTFSGFLNGLDGIASPEGQMFMMTTNHPERLDGAVLRAGRMDLKVELPSTTGVQLEQMFMSFYPGEMKHAKKFREVCENHRLSMADVQNHFITHRHSDAAKAAEDVNVDDLLGRKKLQEYCRKQQEELRLEEEAAKKEAEQKKKKEEAVKAVSEEEKVCA